MIRVDQLYKYYGKKRALNGLSFEVEKGSVVGVVGANGAGKSTLFDILTTLDRRYRGVVKIGGIDLSSNYRSVRHFIGYLPSTFSLYSELTVWENIQFFARMYGADPKEATRFSSWESLDGFTNFRADRLSGGMRQKLAIICAAIHSPKILFLDEPSTGIDPESRISIWEELRHFVSNGGTVVVSTHYYEEFDYLDKILYLDKGDQLLFSSLAEIKGDRCWGTLYYEEYFFNLLKGRGNG